MFGPGAQEEYPSCTLLIKEKGALDDPDEQMLSVAALRAIVCSAPDGKFLSKTAKVAIAPLIRVFVFAGSLGQQTASNSAPICAVPDLLTAVSFCLSRICCTQETATVAYKNGIVEALLKVIPRIPRFDADFRRPRLNASNHSAGKHIQSVDRHDSHALLGLPPAVSLTSDSHFRGRSDDTVAILHFLKRDLR